MAAVVLVLAACGRWGTVCPRPYYPRVIEGGGVRSKQRLTGSVVVRDGVYLHSFWRNQGFNRAASTYAGLYRHLVYRPSNRPIAVR